MSTQKTALSNAVTACPEHFPGLSVKFAEGTHAQRPKESDFLVVRTSGASRYAHKISVRNESCVHKFQPGFTVGLRSSNGAPANFELFEGPLKAKFDGSKIEVPEAAEFTFDMDDVYIYLPN